MYKIESFNDEIIVRWGSSTIDQYLKTFHKMPKEDSPERKLLFDTITTEFAGSLKEMLDDITINHFVDGVEVSKIDFIFYNDEDVMIADHIIYFFDLIAKYYDEYVGKAKFVFHIANAYYTEVIKGIIYQMKHDDHDISSNLNIVFDDRKVFCVHDEIGKYNRITMSDPYGTSQGGVEYDVIPGKEEL